MKRILLIADAPEGAGATPDDSQEKQGKETPNPQRSKKPKRVKVRAKAWISEEIDGDRKAFAPGEVFELPADRVPALGNQVEVVTAT